MKRQHFCSIIVLNFNGRIFLGDCFSSLKDIRYSKNRYEVIMVDNGSNDDSVKFVKSHYPWVKILKLDKNYGFSEGNNRGVEIAKGDYIVFLNNDTKVEGDWLTELVKVAKRSPKIGICGSKMIDQKLAATVGEGYLNILGKLELHSRHNTEKECFFVSGASMLIKKAVLSKLGYCFDPTFFAYFEDVDLCWRAKLLGYEVFYVPQSVVLHKGESTASKMGGIVHFYHYRNKIWTFKKNSRFPLTQLFLILVSITTFYMILCLTVKKRWGQGIRVLKYVFSKKEKTQGLSQISLKDQLRIFKI